VSPFPALVADGIFLLCLGAVVAGALIAALTGRLIRSVCGLALCCIGLAGLYYFLRSPFLALMEILIYVGAVCVTIAFAIMLAEPDEPAQEKEKGRESIWWSGLALLVGGAILWGLAKLGAGAPWAAPAGRLTDGSVAAIGTALLTTYSLAFELISLVLLVAILGALGIARAGRTRS